jgi:hypothetical protein
MATTEGFTAATTSARLGNANAGDEEEGAGVQVGLRGAAGGEEVTGDGVGTGAGGGLVGDGTRISGNVHPAEKANSRTRTRETSVYLNLIFIFFIGHPPLSYFNTRPVECKAFEATELIGSA